MKKQKIRYSLNIAALSINTKNTSRIFGVVPHFGYKPFKNVVSEGSSFRKTGSFISR